MSPIPRDLAPRLLALAHRFPVVILTGPRQCGKTSLCQALFPQLPQISLAANGTLAFTQEAPGEFLARFPHGAILDDLPHCPDLLSGLLKTIIRAEKTGRWIITTTQSLDESTEESMTGHIAMLRMLPLSRAEVVRFNGHPQTLNETLLTGGYPGILAQGLSPAEWQQSYVANCLDIPRQSGDRLAFRRFLRQAAEFVGQCLDISTLANHCGVPQSLAKSWLSRLEAESIVFRLPIASGLSPTRQPRRAKLYFYDSGLVCWLLGIHQAGQLTTHPLKRALFESWIFSEILKARFDQGKPGGLSCAPSLEFPGTPALPVTNSEIIAGINETARHLKRRHAQVRRLVVCDGARRDTRNGIEYLPWREIQEYDWAK